MNRSIFILLGFLVLPALALGGQSTNFENFASAQSFADQKDCLVAVARTNTSMILCLQTVITDKESCEISFVDSKTGNQSSFALLKTGLDTKIISYPSLCSIQSVDRLLKIPTSDDSQVIDLFRTFVEGAGTWAIVKEEIPFSAYIQNSFLMSLPRIDERMSNSGLETRANLSAVLTIQQKQPAVKHHTIPVFYATNRKMIQSGGKINFNGERSTGANEFQDPRITYGTINVSIPSTHSPGQNEQPSIFSLELKSNPDRHIVVGTPTVQSADAFFGSMKNKTIQSTENELMIFVHGYKNSFNDSALRTAQLVYDLQFKGTPVMFSWPSDTGLLGLPFYNNDEDDAAWSEKSFATFIYDVVQKSGAKKIHIVAHSMGNRIIAKALELIHLQKQIPAKTIEQIVMAAPDIDVGLFYGLVRPITELSKRVTIYSSKNDCALRVSSLFHWIERLGIEPYSIPGIDTIDASDTDTSLFFSILQHNYFANRPSIINDIKQVLAGKSTSDPARAPSLELKGNNNGKGHFYFKPTTWGPLLRCPLS